MTCRIALGPNDDFELILPSGRRLSVPIEHGTKYLKRILQDASRAPFERKSYVRNFPTQHVIEQWMKEDRLAKHNAAREKFEEMGIDLDALNLTL